MLYSSHKTRFDVVAKSGNSPVFFVEVQSSPMYQTVLGSIIKGAFLIQYFRYLDQNFSEITMFAFPSLTS